MEISEITKKTQRGDGVTVAAMLGITPDNARVSLRNENSPKHTEVKAAFVKLLNSREQLILDSWKR